MKTDRPGRLAAGACSNVPHMFTSITVPSFAADRVRGCAGAAVHDRGPHNSSEARSCPGAHREVPCPELPLVQPNKAVARHSRSVVTWPAVIQLDHCERFFDDGLQMRGHAPQLRPCARGRVVPALPAPGGGRLLPGSGSPWRREAANASSSPVQVLGVPVCSGRGLLTTRPWRRMGERQHRGDAERDEYEGFSSLVRGSDWCRMGGQGIGLRFEGVKIGRILFSGKHGSPGYGGWRSPRTSLVEPGSTGCRRRARCSLAQPRTCRPRVRSLRETPVGDARCEWTDLRQFMEDCLLVASLAQPAVVRFPVAVSIRDVLGNPEEISRDAGVIVEGKFHGSHRTP